MKVSFFILAFVAFSAYAQPHLENDTHCQPALISQENGDGTGTGFVVKDSVRWFLVTAKHLVVDVKSGKLLSPKYNVLLFSHDLTRDERTTLSVNMVAALDSGKILYNTKDDVVAIELGRVMNGGKEFPHRSYVSVVSGSKAGLIRPVSLPASEEFRNVHMGDAVFLFGYPTALGLKPMPQFDYDKPLLRSGTIAGKYEERHIFVLDCPAYMGNCGSPVLKRSADGKLRLAGIITDPIPSFDKNLDLNGGKRTEEAIYQTNSGYGVVVPIDVVSELVKGKK